MNICRCIKKKSLAVQPRCRRLMTLWTSPPLGAEKPSVLIYNILSLWPNTATKDTSKLLLGLFLRRLPLQMRSQLATFPDTSPAQLAATADAIWTQAGEKVSATEVTVAAAVASRPHSPLPLGPACRCPSPIRVVNEVWRLSLARRWVGLLRLGAAQKHPCVHRSLLLPHEVGCQSPSV